MQRRFFLILVSSCWLTGGGLFTFLSDHQAGAQEKTPASSSRPITSLLPLPAASVAFSPDGKTLALGGFENGTISFWTNDGRLLRKLKQQECGTIFRLSYSLDGKVLESQLVSADDDACPTTVRLFDLEKQKAIFSHEIPWHAVRQARFSADYKTLAYPSKQNAVAVRDIAANKQMHLREWKGQEVVSLEFDSDGKVLVTTTSSGGQHPRTAHLWDLATGQQLREVPYIPFKIDSPDNKRYAAVIGLGPCLGGALILGDRNTASAKPLLMLHALAMPFFSPDGKLLCIVSSREADEDHADQTIAEVWDVGSAKPLFKVGLSESAHFAAFSSDGKVLALGSRKRCLLLPLAHFQGFGGAASILTMSADAKHLAAGEPDGKVRLLDRETGARRHKLVAHEKEIQALCFSPNGTRLATGSSDQLVCVWDTQTGEQLHSFKVKRDKNYRPHIGSLHFSTDGKTLSVNASSGYSEFAVSP